MRLQHKARYAQRLILHAPPWNSEKLKVFVEKCIRDRVVLVCVVGEDCARVEEVIDELVVGDGRDQGRISRELLNTTSHPAESLAEVHEFAKSWTLFIDPSVAVQEVRL